MNTEIIIGNLCSIGAMLSDSFSGTRKTKKAMLLSQCISSIFYITSSIVLKGYSATVQNVVSIFRNIFYAYDKKNKYIEMVLLISPVVLGILFNNRGVIGLLPVIANLEYGVCLLIVKENPLLLKYSFVVCNIMFSVFNFYISNYIGGAFCIIVSATTIFSLVRNK